MPKVTLKGFILVPEPELAVIQQALVHHQRLTQAELGCIVFEVVQSGDNPSRFDVYEEFVDQAAFEFHQARMKASEWGRVSVNVERNFEILPAITAFQHAVRTASLPMYDFPEIESAHDAWWGGIRLYLQEEGVTDVPPLLRHGEAVRTLWDDPQLLLSQCCGYDVVHRYRDAFRILLTPHYAVPGCAGPYYSSRVMVHEDSRFDTLESLRGAIAVINGPESQSGMNSLMCLINPLQQDGTFFSRIRVSGAHAMSLAALQQREADVAAIDCVTYAILERYRPAAVRGLRQIGWTGSAPGLPYVTLTAESEAAVERMLRALKRAFADPALAAAREAVFIDGFSVLGADEYRMIREALVFDRRLLGVVE